MLELVEREGLGAGRAHRIHFDSGLIDEVETSLSAPRVGDVLLGRGAVSKVALARAGQRSSRRIGEVLVAERAVSASVLQEALRSQLGLRLEALFQLKDAFVRFHVRRGFRRDANRPEPLRAEEFLKGRPRKRGGSGRAVRAISASERAALRILGLPLSADSAAVRSAFRRRARELHPDRHPHAGPEFRAELLKRFAELSRAYHLLVKG